MDRRLSAVARLSLIAVVSVAAVVLTAAPATADDVALPTPLPDSFYDAPSEIGRYANGDVIASREMPDPPGLFALRTYQVKFRSTDMYSRPIAAVTTLLVPDGHKADGPLLSVQDIVNAMGLECSPSRQLYASTTDLYSRSGSLTASQRPLLNGAPPEGWSLGHLVLSGPAEFRTALHNSGAGSLCTVGQPVFGLVSRRAEVWADGYSGRRDGDGLGIGPGTLVRTRTRDRGQRLRRCPDELDQDGRRPRIERSTPGIRPRIRRGDRFFVMRISE